MLKSLLFQFPDEKRIFPRRAPAAARRRFRAHGETARTRLDKGFRRLGTPNVQFGDLFRGQKGAFPRPEIGNGL